MAQVPSAAQQAPVGTEQGLVGVQAVPMAKKGGLGCAQAVGATSVHAPFAAQQAPTTTTHGTVAHVDPNPPKTLVPVQLAAITPLVPINDTRSAARMVRNDLVNPRSTELRTVRPVRTSSLSRSKPNH